MEKSASQGAAAIKGGKIIEEKQRRGWASDYPVSGTNMYLLGPDEVYQVRVVASSIWVPKERIWVPEVCITREGINVLVDDLTRLVYNLHTAKMMAAHAVVQRVGAGSITQHAKQRQVAQPSFSIATQTPTHHPAMSRRHPPTPPHPPLYTTHYPPTTPNGTHAMHASERRHNSHTANTRRGEGGT